MEKIYKPQQFAQMLGVTVTTLQRWDRSGKLVAHRNPKGRRFYLHSQYEKHLGIQSENKIGEVIIYTRVSNQSQKMI